MITMTNKQEIWDVAKGNSLIIYELIDASINEIIVEINEK